MIFLRTNDSASLTCDSGSFNFVNNNRKGNSIKKFNLVDGEVSYYYEELNTKMIPKKSLDIFRTHPVKLILTQNQNILVFQDLDCKINFLTFNNGKIIKKKFEDLIPEEDSIICYDEQEDWYLDDIKIVSMAFLEEDIEDEEFKNIELSNYVLISNEGGMIINNIFII
jgi:hypothetical protein